MRTSTQLNQLSALGAAAALLISLGNVGAQDRRGPANADPAELRQRMTDRLREQFEVKDDAEWKIIADKIEKVIEARRATGAPGGPRGPGGTDLGAARRQADPGQGRPEHAGEPRERGVRPEGERGPGRPDAQGAVRPPAERVERGDRVERGGPGAPGGPGGFGHQPSLEADALQKAIEAKESPEDIKAKLAALRVARRAKEAELETAQEELRKLLSVRQEAIAVSAGLLK